MLQKKGGQALGAQLSLAEDAARGKSVVIVLEFPPNGSIEGWVNVAFRFDKDLHDATVLDAMRRVVLCES